MKLAISNIAWDERDAKQVYHYMKELGLDGIEFAPSKIYGMNPYCKGKEVNRFSNKLKETYSLELCSMQSIWYGKKEQLFGSREEREQLLEYTKEAIDFAEQAGCGNLVFGCPKNRSFHELVDKNVAVEFFRELGDYAILHNTVIAIEANPIIYGTNFLISTEEAVNFVREVQSAGIGVNLDFGTMLYNGEALDVLIKYLPIIHHIHVSEINLEPVIFTDKHRILAALLKSSGYCHYVSVEMKLQPVSKVFKIMEEFISIFKKSA